MNITHLILSGGGMHAVVYLGCMKYLYSNGLEKHITHISATSAGTLIALFICLKLSIDDIEMIIKQTIAQEAVCFIPKNNIWSAIDNLGLTSTKYILDPLKKYLKENYQIDDLTFEDIKNRYGMHLYISTTNVCKSRNEIFSYENTPNISVFSACEASMSLPLFYEPKKIGTDYYYDGGLTNNFPISVFENINDEFKLGLALNGKGVDNIEESDKETETISFYSLITKLIATMKVVIRQETIMRHINKDFVIVFEDIPTNWMDVELQDNRIQVFKISEQDIENMLEFGYNETKKYLEKRTMEFDKRDH